MRAPQNLHFNHQTFHVEHLLHLYHENPSQHQIWTSIFKYVEPHCELTVPIQIHTQKYMNNLLKSEEVKNHPLLLYIRQYKHLLANLFDMVRQKFPTIDEGACSGCLRQIIMKKYGRSLKNCSTDKFIDCVQAIIVNIVQLFEVYSFNPNKLLAINQHINLFVPLENIFNPQKFIQTLPHKPVTVIQLPDKNEIKICDVLGTESNHFREKKFTVIGENNFFNLGSERIAFTMKGSQLFMGIYDFEQFFKDFDFRSLLLNSNCFEGQSKWTIFTTLSYLSGFNAILRKIPLILHPFSSFDVYSHAEQSSHPYSIHFFSSAYQEPLLIQDQFTLYWNIGKYPLTIISFDNEETLEGQITYESLQKQRKCFGKVKLAVGAIGIIPPGKLHTVLIGSRGRSFGCYAKWNILYKNPTIISHYLTKNIHKTEQFNKIHKKMVYITIFKMLLTQPFGESWIPVANLLFTLIKNNIQSEQNRIIKMKKTQSFSILQSKNQSLALFCSKCPAEIYNYYGLCPQEQQTCLQCLQHFIIFGKAIYYQEKPQKMRKPLLLLQLYKEKEYVISETQIKEWQSQRKGREEDEERMIKEKKALWIQESFIKLCIMKNIQKRELIRQKINALSLLIKNKQKIKKQISPLYDEYNNVMFGLWKLTQSQPFQL